MAYDKTPLKKHLDSLPLLNEEKEMWMRLGFYISAEPITINDLTRVVMVDAPGNIIQVSPQSGLNIRKTILEWWQQEKVKPRSQEPRKVVVSDGTGLDELENRSS